MSDFEQWPIGSCKISSQNAIILVVRVAVSYPLAGDIRMSPTFEQTLNNGDLMHTRDHG